MECHTFSDSLKLSLDLQIGDDIFTIPGADIKRCHLNLYLYGFDGYLSFRIPADGREDTLITPFTTLDLIKVNLGIIAVYNLPDPPPEPLQVQGVVTTKSVREVSYPAARDNPVLQRLYEIHFKDLAQVLWRQHFPTALFTQTTMKAIIAAQTVEGMSLEMDWDVLDQEQAMICLGLGSPANTASFYDFLTAYLAFNDGMLTYDYATQTYQITGKKSTDGEAVSFLPQDIARIVTTWPETDRHNVHLLNGLADNPATEAITQEQAVTGIRHDRLVRMPIPSHLNARKQLETAKLKTRGPELVVDFGQFPLQTFRPGSFLKLDAVTWSKDALYVGVTYRAFRIRLCADAINPNPEDDFDPEFTQYRVQYQTELESQASTWLHYPPFQPPAYPIYVEGKIISEIGDKPDKTYQIETDETTAEDQYRVSIPLWDKEIKIVYEPGFLNPHFYFPLYRDTKLLIALYLDNARIVRVLDWGARVRLAMDTQGNHILFGKNETDETSLQYVYQDGKPVLSLKRVLDNDTELVQLEEGAIILQTKEGSS